MKSYMLTYGEDQEHGSMGFRIEGTKINPQAYNMATDGLLIAHDIMEHARLKDIGTIGDELKALGGVWYVRGQHGELRRDRVGSAFNIHQNVAADIMNMGRDIILGDKRYHAKVPALAQCAVIDDLRDIIEYARKDLLSELQGETYDPKILSKYLDDSLRFMVRGYNHAKKRYERRLGKYGANNAFWAIAEAVDGALKQADFEGQQFKLVVNMKAARAHCEEHYGEDY